MVVFCHDGNASPLNLVVCYVANHLLVHFTHYALVSAASLSLTFLALSPFAPDPFIDLFETKACVNFRFLSVIFIFIFVDVR